jgi:hypothetical protein
MTDKLKSQLEKYRDEKVYSYRPNTDVADPECRAMYDNCSHMDWCRGFDCAKDLLLPVIEKLIEQRNESAEIKYAHPDEVCHTYDAEILKILRGGK